MKTDENVLQNSVLKFGRDYPRIRMFSSASHDTFLWPIPGCSMEALTGQKHLHRASVCLFCLFFYKPYTPHRAHTARRQHVVCSTRQQFGRFVHFLKSFWDQRPAAGVTRGGSKLLNPGTVPETGFLKPQEAPVDLGSDSSAETPPESNRRPGSQSRLSVFPCVFCSAKTNRCQEKKVDCFF